MSARNEIIRGLPKFELHARLQVAQKRRAWYSEDRRGIAAPDLGAMADLMVELRADFAVRTEHRGEMALVA